jgi:predicted Na+-dependent transporter
MWETRLVRREALSAIRGRGTIVAMLLLLLLSMFIGWLIGGPDRESRRVLATSTGMRSVVVVLYVARYCFPGSNVHMIPIVYLSHDQVLADNSFRVDRFGQHSPTFAVTSDFWYFWSHFCS